MDLLLAAPAAVKVGVMFAMILVVNRFGITLGLAIAICAVGLGLWSGAGMAGLRFQGVQFLNADNLLLLVVILALLFLTESLGASGRIERTINSLRAMFRKPAVPLAGMPALIGLLPMPGGALVSAPLVASLDTDNRLKGDFKVALNYWFRHIWEFWWPLYPGVVLALKYSELPPMWFYAQQLPLTVVALVAGYFFILRHVPDMGGVTLDYAKPRGADTAAALVPIGLLVLFSLAGSPVLRAGGMSPTVANLLSMLAGLLVALLLVFINSPASLPKASRMLISGKTWSLMLVVGGVQLFAAALKCPLDSNGATLVSTMGRELLAAGIPVVLVMVAIPFVAGFVTGVALGFVGISFPLVFGLLGQSPDTGALAATTMLAYTSGYVGMMLSPIHVCFVVTNEYFKVKSLGPTYRYLWGPAVLVLLAAAALSAFYRWIF
jgi:uncharacterized protein